jgi:hypothetical protein
MMKLTVDEIYPPPKDLDKLLTGDSPYTLDGFPSNINLWYDFGLILRNLVCKY